MKANKLGNSIADRNVEEGCACLRLADIEDAAAAGALTAEAAQLAAREPHVAGNEQDGGRQAQQLLLPAQLVGIGDGHPGGGRPAQVLLRLLHLALKAVYAADVEEELVLAASSCLFLLCARRLEPVCVGVPAPPQAHKFQHRCGFKAFTELGQDADDRINNKTARCRHHGKRMWRTWLPCAQRPLRWSCS